MIRAVSAYLILFAVAAHAEEWVVREPQVVPESETRSELRVASTVHGALAMWKCCWRETTRAALVEPGAAGTTMPFHVPESVFASDGQDYLLVSYKSAFLMRGDTGERIVLDDPWWQDVSGHAIAWNGRAYVLVFNREGYHFVILLDRRGAPISGELALGSNVDVKVACSGSSCMLIAESFYGRDRAEGGVITEADFPPAGESVRLLLPQFPPARSMARLAGNAGGFASVRIAGGRLVYQRITLADGQETEDGAPRRFRFGSVARPLALDGPPVTLAEGYGALVSLTLDGDSAYAGIGGRLVKIDDGAVQSIDLGEPAVEAAVALPPGGPVAFYISQADRQVRAFPLTGDTGSAARLRVSSEYARFASPRIASGGGVHLAVWQEGLSAVYRILAGEGRPLTAPVSFPRLPRPNGDRFFIAFSGTAFFIVWGEAGGDVRAALVGLDGTLLKAPFTVAENVWGDVTSAVWHDGRYFVAARGRIIRLTAEGDVVDGEPVEAGLYSDALYLAADGGKLFGLGEDVGEIICTCIPTVRYEIVELDDSLRPDPISRHGGSLTSGPVFVAGGGHRLLLWRDWTEYRVAGDAGELVIDDFPAVGRGLVDGVWTSGEFLIGRGTHLAHHAPDGSLLRVERLPEGTEESAVSGDGAGGIVLMVRGEPDTIIVSRLRP